MVQRRGGAVRDESSVVHQENPVAQRNGVDLIVCHHDHRDVEAPLKLLEFIAQIDLDHRVQRRKRLVKQHQPVSDDERARDCRALLHSAGKLGRVLMRGMLDVQRVKRIRNFLLDLRLVRLFDPQGICDVVVQRHVREKCVVLKDDGDSALVYAGMGDVLSLERNGSRVGFGKTHDAAKQRGLSATARPQKRYEFAFVHAKTDVFENLRRSECLAQALYAQEFFVIHSARST